MDKEIRKNEVPLCIGIIMDGNRRWAKENGLPRVEGHWRGYQKMQEVISWCKEIGVKNLVVYAFSTENWNRSEEEVSFLLDIFRTMVTKELEQFKNENVRVRFVGQKERFSEDIRGGMNKMEEATKTGEYSLFVCLSYGGRAEILSAIQKITREKTKEEIDQLSENDVRNYLWTKEMPDPDIIIRTGGEKRLSNFLPWQSVYSELFFSETFFPAFLKEQFVKIIDEYQQRERRKGG